MSLDLEFSNVTETHKRVIQQIYDNNPTARLEQIAEVLNETPDLATCFVTFNKKLLKSLGFKQRKKKLPSSASDNGHDEQQVGSLSQSQIRVQLEKRHAAFEERIDAFLAKEALSQNDAKTLNTLVGLDVTLLKQILELMQQESAPLLPQAQIIRCLRKLGISEEEIKLLDTTVEI